MLPRSERCIRQKFAAAATISSGSMEMSMISKTGAIVIASLGLIAAAFADDAAPDNDHGRYTFGKIGEGFLRLDGQTGAVSVCSQHAVGWACQAVPEDRAVLENEIARLRSENVTLKKEMLAHGLALPAGAMPETAGVDDGSLTLRLPDNADVDHAMAFVGRVWHRFVEAIARAQKQMLNKS
jgi:hypothetical protein